jgi:hypothetical protein
LGLERKELILHSTVKAWISVRNAANAQEAYLLVYSEANRRQLARENEDNQARIPRFY